MTPRPLRNLAPPRGFTLVECIIVIVVLGLAAVAVSKMNGFVSMGQSSIDQLQVRTTLMQECAEAILATRRRTTSGYLAVTTASLGADCGGLAALAGYTVPSVSITDPFTGAACPANSTCKTVTITSGSASPLTLLLVDY